MTETDPDQLRALNRETWETAAAGWGREADAVRDWGMPVSVAMVESLDLQPSPLILIGRGYSSVLMDIRDRRIKNLEFGI